MPPRRHRRLLITPAIILLLMAIALAIPFTLALQGGHYVPTTHDPSAVLTQIRLAERQGDLVTLDNEGLNQLLAIFASRLTKKPPLPGLAILGLNGTMDGDLVTLYAPATYRGRTLLFTAAGRLAYTDERIAFAPQRLTIGQLRIPPRLALGVLSRIQLGALTITSDAITLSISFIPFSFSALAISDGRLSLQVEPFPSTRPSLISATPPILPLVASSAPSTAVDSASNPTQPPSRSTSPQNPSPTPITTTPSTPSSQSPSGATSPTTSPSSSSGPSSQPPQPTPSSATITQNLSRLHGQLGAVLAEMTTAGQRQIISLIQASVGRTIADPNHDFVPEAQYVRTLYGKLSNDERTAIKIAILTNIDTTLIVELRKTYGI